MKRGLDITISLAGLVVLAPLLVLVALLIKLDSKGTVFFRQERIGRWFRPFRIYKFRTMYRDAASQGPAITIGDDRRITRIGRLLRKTKIDELPQLINVLAGDMSLVGPRPEVREYVEMFAGDYETILAVRPGITDLASIKFRNESTILGQAEHPQEEYIKRVLPEKIRLGKEYVRRSSLPLDAVLLLRTLMCLTAAHSLGGRDAS
jgi:lipopolysaccharide/colanic/teichoic acid biosynthesis glycosyltransferase